MMEQKTTADGGSPWQDTAWLAGPDFARLLPDPPADPVMNAEAPPVIGGGIMARDRRIATAIAALRELPPEDWAEVIAEAASLRGCTSALWRLIEDLQRGRP